MSIQNTAALSMSALALPQQTIPAPAQADGRATADAAAISKDPSPEVPLPMPANASQIGLISKAAISEKDPAAKIEVYGVSAAERTLKPYGINMLPEVNDAPKQKAPAEDARV